MRNDALWSNVVFEKELISRSNIKRLQGWRLLLCIWKHVHQRCFFIHYSVATSMTNLVQIFTNCLFCALCWDTPSENTGLCHLPKVSTASQKDHAATENRIGLMCIHYTVQQTIMYYSVSTLLNLHHNNCFLSVEHFSLCSLINHPRVWTDPIGYYSTFADAGFAILAGEFSFHAL